MDTKNINLEDISKIPESQFKEHFREWLEGDGVARALQAKLRKDLIETFNQTCLGRKMYSQQQKSSRIMLSPLILATNTLVAEFLYAQNCHFSLSVFSTEVPYRNTLPDFENSSQFRFSKTELFEIFEAISGGIQHDLKDSIIEEYIQPATQHGTSLLYLILKKVFKRHEEPEKVIITEPKKDNPDEKSKKEKKDTQQTGYNHQFRYLNKYLVILSRKVKDMADNLEHLQKRGQDGSNVQRKSLKDRKLETLNRSLEKISENLRNLSISKRKNRNVSVVLSAVDKLAQQFEKCASNFETISKKVTHEKSEKVRLDEEKSYSEWITELKTSKSGKKFIARVESCLKKTLQQEKQKMQQAFDAQLETQKQLIKLKYKQRVLVQLGQHTSKEEDDNGKKATDLIEEKLLELDKKHQELLKRVAVSEERVRTSPKYLNLQKDLAATSEPTDNQNNINYASSQKYIITNKRLEEEKPQTFDLIDRVKPQLEEMAKTIAQHERNIDHIVFDAKLRIQELEYESNQLDRSFQDYLDRQKNKNSNLEEGASSIWEKYNFEKIMLNKKCEALRSTRNMKDLRSKDDIQIEKIIPNLPQIYIVPDEGILRRDPPEIHNITFENPFRKLKEEMLAKKGWTNFEISEALSRATSKPHEITNKDEISKVNEQSRNNLEFSKDLLRYNFRRASNVHVISHDSKNNNKISKLKEDVISKGEQTRRITSDHHHHDISSELNLNEAIFDGIEISPSKSSSSKSETKDSRNTLKCRRSLFTDKQNQQVVKETINIDAPTTSDKKSSSSNIFQQSSYLQPSYLGDKDNNVKQPDRDNNEPENTSSALNLDIPTINSPSSNSTSPSFKLNLSVGRGDDASGDDFWS